MDPKTHVKNLGVVASAYAFSTGRGRQAGPWGSQPAVVAKSVSSRPVGHAVAKNKGVRLERLLNS